MTKLEAVASRHSLPIVEDCCQAHLATAGDRPVGSIGVAGAFSFYPTKNLPALGDAGAVVTKDAALADRIRRLRNGGQSTRYRHELAGVNSRLDELQAAVLRARLPFLSSWTDRRRAIARQYRRALASRFACPLQELDAGHVYHLFVVRADGHRDALVRHLREEGVDTLVHYPVPITRQPAFSASDPSRCPQADVACSNILSLPLYPGLSDEEVQQAATALNAFNPDPMAND
jgi:dTDP-3-amino-3,4,6-trideoxy-alpha-D-glucose transaminase